MTHVVMMDAIAAACVYGTVHMMWCAGSNVRGIQVGSRMGTAATGAHVKGAVQLGRRQKECFMPDNLLSDVDA